MTAIISPEGSHIVPPLKEGEGILTADLDLGLIVKRKRMMDSVGHYARPELLKLVLDNHPARPMEVVHEPSTPAHELSNGSACDEGERPNADRAVDQRVAVLRDSAR